MAATRQMKQQISDIIMNDASILKAIAQAVSSLIVEKLASHEETIKLVANNLSNNRDFVSLFTESITSDIEREKDKIKQEITDSLSFDHQQVEKKYEELEKVNRNLVQQIKDLEWAVDSQEQYSRRNCLLFHGITESAGETNHRLQESVIGIMNGKLGMNIKESDIDRLHRIGRPRFIEISTTTSRDQ